MVVLPYTLTSELNIGGDDKVSSSEELGRRCGSSDSRSQIHPCRAREHVARFDRVDTADGSTLESRYPRRYTINAPNVHISAAMF